MFESITDSLGNVFDRMRGRKRLTGDNIQEAMREVRVALLEADVAHTVVRDFIGEVSEKALGEDVVKSVNPADMVVKIVNDCLVEFLGGEAIPLELSAKPSVIMFCGLQGSGKTTTVGKLATRLIAEGRKPLLVAADIQRPAAIEQLRILGEQIGAQVYSEAGGDPVKICARARSVAELHSCDTIILDTAGRLHIDEGLMAELESIVSKTSPDEVLLVLDAMTGQDAVNSAQEFSRRLPLTGAIMTKLDGDARGGAALSLRKVTGVPIKFVGIGEKLDALEEFHPDRMAGRILGMGDIVSLVEKAQLQVDEEEQAKIQEKLLKNSFTLEDFQKQLAQIRKMGSIKDLLGMIPGLGRKLKGIDIDDKEFFKIEVIIQSMTKKEKSFPEIIDYPRKDRIARGSGTQMGDVTQLLKQFREMKKMIGKLGRSGMLGGLLGGGMPDFSDAAAAGPLGGIGGMNSFAPPRLSDADRKLKKKERKKQKQNRKKRR